MSSQATEAHDFWDFLDLLLQESPVVIDRPQGSIHPHYPALIYPLDYGYLSGTSAIDGGGIDVWLGSQDRRRLDGLIVTVDLFKRDAEIKLLLGCNVEEQQIALSVSNDKNMRACLISRGGKLEWLRSRQTVRHFQKRPLPEGMLQRLLETAVWAPSAHNRQPWRFVVLESQEAKQQLVDCMGNTWRKDLTSDGVKPIAVEERISRSRQRILKAPAAVLLCLDTSQLDSYQDSLRKHSELLTGVQSVALAGGYLLLAAHVMGLAGCWLCAPLFVPQAVRMALGLPIDWLPQALILLGYPAQKPPRRSRKVLEEVVRYL